MIWRILLCATVCLSAVVQTVAAQNQTANFSLSIRGIKVGEIALTAVVTPRNYDLTGRLRNTGLMRAIRHFDYSGTTKGTVLGDQLSPTWYRESADTGRRKSSVEMTYANRVPTIIRYDSTRPRPDAVPDPALMSGAVDPLSAMFLLLRDVDPSSACRLDITIFDGRRESRLSAQLAGSSGGLPVCVGRFARLRGYSPEELERHPHFDYQLTYRRDPAGRLMVDHVVFDSVYGQAVIDRR